MTNGFDEKWARVQAQMYGFVCPEIDAAIECMRKAYRRGHEIGYAEGAAQAATGMVDTTKPALIEITMRPNVPLAQRPASSMTVREKMAMVVLQGMVSDQTRSGTLKEFAEAAVRQVDELLAALSQETWG